MNDDERDYLEGEPVYGGRTPKLADWLGLAIVAGVVLLIYALIVAFG